MKEKFKKSLIKIKIWDVLYVHCTGNNDALFEEKLLF